MRVFISPKPEILSQRKEVRYYVYVQGAFSDKEFTVSVFIPKNHKLLEDVEWAPLEAKIVKPSYDFFEDFLLKVLLKDDIRLEDLQQVLENATSTEEAFENILRGYSNYLFDYLVKEIYRLDFDGVNIYLFRKRRVKASSIKERRVLEEELQDGYFDDKDIPALHIVSEYAEYKVPFDTTKDENDEPLNKFVLINEEDAKKIVKEALKRNWNWSPVKTKWFSDDDLPTTPTRVLYLSPYFRELVYRTR